MSSYRIGLSLLSLVATGPAAPAVATVTGGGPAKSDCYAEFGGVTATRGKTTVECVEGTACDQDGVCDDACDFGVQLCLNQSDVPGCTRPGSGLASLTGTIKLGSVATPFSITGPALTAAACGALPGGSIVALRRNKKGKLLGTTETIVLTATARPGVRPTVDRDKLKLVCRPSPTPCAAASSTTTTISTPGTTTSTSTSTSASSTSTSSETTTSSTLTTSSTEPLTTTTETTTSTSASTSTSTSTTTTPPPTCQQLPVATPTATAPSGMPLAPPPPHAAALVVKPLDTVTLHGAATDPAGDTSFTFRWRLLSTPDGNTAGLSGAPGGGPDDVSTQTSPTLFAQLAGDYVVEAVAVDPSGCASDPATVLVRVTPTAPVLVQLTWDEPLDMDLQLVNGSATPFSLTMGDPNHCFWGNRAATWGGVTASLDIDDLIGCNPEEVSLNGSSPAAGSTYAVYVHLYCHHRGHLTAVTTNGYACYETRYTTSANPTVRVFVGGVQAKIDGTATDAVFTRTLTNGAVWPVAGLRFDGSAWHVTKVDQALAAQVQCADASGQQTCACGNSEVNNTSDPYCGSGGAGCRQKFP